MSKGSKTAQEFIQSSFSPNIAILSSNKADIATSKNNLTFSELLQPFSILDWEGQFKEPGGNVCIVKNWKLIIKNVNWKPLQPTEARKQLNNAVLYNYHDQTVSLDLGSHTCNIPTATNWFDAWRETYFEVQFPSDHEFTKHFLACVLVATANDDNIIDTYNSLNQQYAQLQNVTPPKLPKWFNNGVLKSYLLLHDVSVLPKEKADATFEIVKQNFGATNCFMLSINSKNTTDPVIPIDYWAQYIKRSSDTNTEMTSSLTTSPLEPLPTLSSPIVVTDDSQLNTSNQPEGLHPLTTNEIDVFDNANSLQTHSFSGSSESVNVTGRPLDYITEVHGAALNSTDIEAIKKFLIEYASKALLPYLEKQISQLSEVVANRKGVSRSLLSATKRWFGTGKGGGTTGSNTVIYSNDCPELQLRRLGDLWFLCGQWQRAFDAYHTAKREFYGDSAWLCYAGALEMAALSAFMAGDANRKTYGYMEESIVTYLNVCRMVQYAVRATLLSTLCLNSAGMHGEAAKQLIRMTSEDSDLRSAMLLEQAALCFMSGPGAKAMCRKYAFHMVLAGHRFSKAGQKKHAYRCYKQAYEIYESSGWRLSTDHVQFALGRLAGALRRSRDAVRWLAAPLAPRLTSLTAQHQHQQDAFLREYMLAHQQWVASSEEFKDQLPVLPLPLLELDETAVLCVGPAPLSSPGRQPASSLNLKDANTRSQAEDRCWQKLEEMLLQVAQGSVPMIFKPTIDLYTNTTDANPVVPQGEPIQFSVTLRNPLKIALLLRDVELLWRFSPILSEDDPSQETLSNEPLLVAGNVVESNVIYAQKIKSVLLEGDSKTSLIFSLTPLRVGQLSIHGLAYKLINAGEKGSDSGNSVSIMGKVNLTSEGNSSHKRLQITIIPETPCLQMTFSETSPDVLSGEMRTIDMELRNVGPVHMGDVYISVSHPNCVYLVTSDECPDNFTELYEDKYQEIDTAELRVSGRGLAARHVRHVTDTVSRGAAVRARVCVRVCARTPRLQLLAYYAAPTHPRQYRLLRHVFNFNVNEAIDMIITPRRSLKKIENEVYENMNLAIEVKNISNELHNMKIEVLEASMLSRQWKLTEFNAGGGNTCLMPRETLHIILKARRIAETPSDGVIEWSNQKLSNDPASFKNINTIPYSKFVNDSKSSFIDIMDIVSEQPNKKATGMVQSMVVVRWKASDPTTGKSVVGQHCLWLECFAKVKSRKKDIRTPETPVQLEVLETKSDAVEGKTNKNKDNVVIFRMEHAERIVHDFNARKLCTIPITLNIVNCYGEPVKVFIDLTKTQSRDSSSELGWAGALSSSPDGDSSGVGVSVSLDRFECARVCVRGVCAAPGTYPVGAAMSVTHPHARDSYSNDSSLLVVQQPA